MRSKTDGCKYAELLSTALLILLIASIGWTQEPAKEKTPDSQTEEQDEPTETVAHEIVVTGSRIAKNPVDEPAPVLELTEQDLERSGLTNIGSVLQQLPVTGSAVNTKFNVPGNSGFPQGSRGERRKPLGHGSARRSPFLR